MCRQFLGQDSHLLDDDAIHGGPNRMPFLTGSFPGAVGSRASVSPSVDFMHGGPIQRRARRTDALCAAITAIVLLVTTMSTIAALR